MMLEVLKTAMRITLVYIAVCLLVWALLPDYRTVTAGLILGAIASSMNALLLRRRVEAIGHAAAFGGKRRMGMGLSSRLATVVLAVMIAMKFPEQFAVPATLASCFIVPFAAFIAAVLHNNRQLRRKG